MYIEDYLIYTKDKVISIEGMSGDNGETINKVITKFGNILYWESNTGKIISAEWRVPGILESRKLNEKELEEISGKYFLISYGEKWVA
jgi:hypothetical protein